jgi:hypothetical protein
MEERNQKLVMIGKKYGIERSEGEATKGCCEFGMVPNTPHGGFFRLSSTL